MQLFNTLIDRVSQDEEYLQTTLRPAAEYDDFTVSNADMITATHAASQALQYLYSNTVMLVMMHSLTCHSFNEKACLC